MIRTVLVAHGPEVMIGSGGGEYRFSDGSTQPSPHHHHHPVTMECAISRNRGLTSDLHMAQPKRKVKQKQN